MMDGRFLLWLLVVVKLDYFPELNYENQKEKECDPVIGQQEGNDQEKKEFEYQVENNQCDCI